MNSKDSPAINFTIWKVLLLLAPIGLEQGNKRAAKESS